MCLTLHGDADHRCSNSRIRAYFPLKRLNAAVAILLVLPCVLAACAGYLSAGEDIGQRWAVLVGINDYAELQDLQFCKNDVEALASALEKAGFPQRNIFVLSDGASDANNLPNKGNIETRIKNVLSVAADGDTVLIGFNCHGVSLGGRTYLCPMEAREDNPEGTMIPLLTVYDALRQSQARFKLLLVDACRNDALPAGSRSATAVKESRDQFLADLEAAVPKGIVTLASCAEDQKAWEEPALRHGVFTHFLLEGLAGKADQEEAGNRDQRVSLLELYKFALGMHEVTVGQFRQFVESQSYQTEAERDGNGGYGFNVTTGSFEQDKQYSWRSPGFAQADDHPVVTVSWNDAVAFCTWLSGQEGKRYALPTEAQWEFACRAGSTTEYSYGDDPEQLTVVGNVADAAAKGKCQDWSVVSSSDGYVFTSPVGKFQANVWGLYDMHGNVWEWCTDWYDEGYYQKSPVDDPLGAATGSDRVFRGGGWPDFPGFCRSAGRIWGTPVLRGGRLGFRVALVPAE